MKINDILRNKVAKNASWLIFGNTVNKILAFIVSILIAKYLGPSDYGLINYSMGYVTFFYSISTLGINNILVKLLVDKENEEGEVLGTTIILQLYASILSICLICLISCFIDFGEKTTIIVTILCSLSLLFQVLDTFKYWFQAKLKSKYASIAMIFAYVMMSAYKIILLIFRCSLYTFALATSVEYFFMALFLYFSYKKNKGPRLKFSKITAKKILKLSAHYILSGLMVSIYSVCDKFMLKQMLDQSNVGYYGTAMSICNIWVFILSSIIDSYNPIIMNEKEELMFNKKNRQLYCMIFYISIIISIMIVIFAKPGILLLYGEPYRPSIAPLRIMTWYVAFSYLGVARNAWIVCKNQQKYLTPIYILAAISNVILNFLLIPRFGVNGAAIATLLTQMGTIYIFPLFKKSMRPNVKLMLESILFIKLK